MTSKNKKQEILNYEKQFKELTDFKEIVRQMPGMYIGALGNKGVINMYREILQNAFDQFTKSSFCDTIYVFFDEKNYIWSISDNGNGIPFEYIVKAFINQHLSTNYEKKLYDYSSGRHGVGAKVTNVLCEFFEVYSYILGEGKYVRFEEGLLVQEPKSIKNPDNRQGTTIVFKPSSFMGNLTITYKDVLELIVNLFPLYKIGTKVIFECTTKEGKKITQTIQNKDGILTHLTNMSTKPLVSPIHIFNDTGVMRADIMFTFDINTDEPNILSFANFTPVVAGTHIDAFLDAICKYFKDYMNKIYLAGNKKNKIVVTNNDIKTSLIAVVTVCHLEPIFVGQSKDMLSNEDIIPFIKDLTLATLDEWSKTNAKDLQKISKYIKEIAEIRMKSEEGKVKLSNKYESNTITGLPKKYVKPTGKEHLELIITEGDSALGPAKNSRCTIRQGLFPIRGKLPNAFNTIKNKFLSNEEVASIIQIIGAGYGKNFDISKCKFDKIIFMTDADSDGFHIRSLLLSFFLMYMPQLVLDGRVYAATPPLYGLNVGTAKKKTYKYFTDRKEYIEYIQKFFSKQYKVVDYKGITLSSNELVGLLYRNVLYKYELELVANNFALNPKLLEFVLLHKDEKLSSMKKLIKTVYGKHVTVEEKNNNLVIHGLVGQEVETLFLNDALLQESKYILDLIHNVNGSEINYVINGEYSSIYDMMCLFDQCTPKEITRYKGLGEMNDDQLAQSTLHPDMDRTLIRYTMEDAKREIEAIRAINNDKAKLAKSVKVSRMDILG